MTRLVFSLAMAGTAWLAGAAAQGQPPSPAPSPSPDCRQIADDAYNEWVATPALLHCVKGGNGAAESVLGMIHLGAGGSTSCDKDGCHPEDPTHFGLPAAMSVDDLNREGLRLLMSASTRGQADAMNEIGIANLDGSAGLVQDPTLARDWFERATEAGDMYGPYNLARLYFSGRGVEQSAETAEHYLRLSAQRGYRPAICSLARIVAGKSVLNRITSAILNFTGGDAARDCDGYDIMNELD